MTGGWSPFFNIKMGFCSAVTLAFATIFSLAAVALLAIAFSTDNWITIHVNLRGKDLQVESSPLKLLNSKSFWTRSGQHYELVFIYIKESQLQCLVTAKGVLLISIIIGALNAYCLCSEFFGF